MSAIAVTGNAEAFHLAADTAGYDPETGAFLFEREKAVVIDRLKCVVANTGAGGFVDWVVWAVDRAPQVTTFDHLIAALPALVLDIQREMEERGTTTPEINSTVIAIGYSERLDRVCAVRVLSCGKESMGADGAPVSVPAGDMQELGKLFATSAPAAQSCADCGFSLDDLDGMPGRELVVRIVCALRRESRVRDMNDPVSYGVGGRLMYFRVTRKGVWRETVHEWPDVTDEPINPDRGQRLPAWLR